MRGILSKRLCERGTNGGFKNSSTRHCEKGTIEHNHHVIAREGRTKQSHYSKLIYLFIIISIISLSLSSCEKEITLDLPQVESKLVVEGFIEQGQPPVLILSRSAGYFEPTDSSAIEALSVKNALVTMSDGTRTDSLKILFPQYPVYTTFSNFGQIGKTYTIKIIVDGKEYSAKTSIPVPVKLDKVYFKLEPETDSLGFVWANMTEPVGEGQAYRWFAQRVGKDRRFLPPLGSAFDDKFIDGTSFEFGFARGREPNSSAPDDTSEERGYFKVGDSIIVKFTTIDHDAFEYLRTYETEVMNNGNPFAAPSSVKTNITGGALGAWIGYGSTFDTIKATK